eukprot:1798586-Rhodomonas_salina.1
MSLRSRSASWRRSVFGSPPLSSPSLLPPCSFLHTHTHSLSLSALNPDCSALGRCSIQHRDRGRERSRESQRKGESGVGGE